MHSQAADMASFLFVAFVLPSVKKPFNRNARMIALKQSGRSSV
jgi:hypothetical protein